VSDPTTVLRGAIRSPVTVSHAAVTEAKPLGQLLRAIDGFDGQPTTRIALQLMALLYPRPGELRMARWEEFDFELCEWLIPAERMKMRIAHYKPLSRQAIALLEELRTLTADIGEQGSKALLFPSLRTWQKPISENTLNAALRRLGYSKDEATAHGFRASASTLLNESKLWHADAVERSLAHEEPNKVRRVYARGEYWDERVKMAQWWADQLDAWRAGRADNPASPRGAVS
jgi:integrase